MKDFWKFAAYEFFSFLLIVLNMRAIAKLNYLATGVTDALFCALTWTSVKAITDSSGWAGRVGNIVGGVSGSLLALWLTQNWK